MTRASKSPPAPVKLASVMVTAAITVIAAAALAGCAAPAAAPAPAPAYPYNSVQRFEQLDRLAMQIVRKTASTPDVDYQDRVRPGLPARLARLGLSAEETAQVLGRVDEARADRQRVRQWWSDLTSPQPTTHARR